MTIAYVQSKSIATASALSVNVTLTSNVTAGNALIAGGYDGNGINQTDTIADTVNAGNYANDNSVNLTTDGDTVGIFSKLNAGAGSTKITLTRSSTGGSLRLVAHEYSGLATSAALDQTATGHNTSSTSGTTSNVTTTQASELIFCVLGCAGADTVTSNSPFTQRENTGFPGGFASQDQVVSSTGTFAANYTISPADEYGAIIATYKAPGGGGNVTVNLTQVAATGAVGTVSPATAVGITQDIATGAVGNLLPSTAVTPLQVAAAGSLGNLTPSSQVALTQAAVTGALGTIVPVLSVNLSEVAGTGAVGTLSPSNDSTVSLSGVSATGSVGSVTASGGDQGASNPVIYRNRNHRHQIIPPSE